MSFVIQHHGKPVRVSWRADTAKRFAIVQHTRGAVDTPFLSWSPTGKLLATVQPNLAPQWTGWEVLDVPAIKAWGKP